MDVCRFVVPRRQGERGDLNHGSDVTLEVRASCQNEGHAPSDDRPLLCHAHLGGVVGAGE